MWSRCGHFDNRPLASWPWSNAVISQSVNQQENIVCWKISCCRKVGKENSATNWFLQVHATSTNGRKWRNKLWTRSNNRVDTDSKTAGRNKCWAPTYPQTTDGAGRTKVPTKTGRFWAWVSAHQETVWKVKDCLQLLQVEWFDSWRWLHYIEDENDMVCHACTRPHITHQLATLMIDAAFFATWNIPVSPGSCREMHHPSRHDQECRRAHIIIARKG